MSLSTWLPVPCPPPPIPLPLPSRRLPFLGAQPAPFWPLQACSSDWSLEMNPPNLQSSAKAQHTLICLKCHILKDQVFELYPNIRT